jgi:hypothetical protein
MVHVFLLQGLQLVIKHEIWSKICIILELESRWGIEVYASLSLWVFFALAIYDIALCVMCVFTTQMERDKLLDGWAWIDMFHLFV